LLRQELGSTVEFEAGRCAALQSEADEQSASLERARSEHAATAAELLEQRSLSQQLEAELQSCARDSDRRLAGLQSEFASREAVALQLLRQELGSTVEREAGRCAALQSEADEQSALLERIRGEHVATAAELLEQRSLTQQLEDKLQSCARDSDTRLADLQSELRQQLALQEEVQDKSKELAALLKDTRKQHSELESDRGALEASVQELRHGLSESRRGCEREAAHSARLSDELERHIASWRQTREALERQEAQSAGLQSELDDQLTSQHRALRQQDALHAELRSQQVLCRRLEDDAARRAVAEQASARRQGHEPTGAPQLLPPPSPRQTRTSAWPDALQSPAASEKRGGAQARCSPFAGDAPLHGSSNGAARASAAVAASSSPGARGRYGHAGGGAGGGGHGDEARCSPFAGDAPLHGSSSGAARASAAVAASSSPGARDRYGHAGGGAGGGGHGDEVFLDIQASVHYAPRNPGVYSPGASPLVATAAFGRGAGLGREGYQQRSRDTRPSSSCSTPLLSPEASTFGFTARSADFLQETLSATASTSLGGALGGTRSDDSLGEEDSIARSPGFWPPGRAAREEDLWPEFVVELVAKIEREGWHKVPWVDNYTLLHSAANFNKPALCKLLLAQRADPEVQDNVGKTPLEYAAESGSLEAAAVLRSGLLLLASTPASALRQGGRGGGGEEPGARGDYTARSLLQGSSFGSTWPEQEQNAAHAWPPLTAKTWRHDEALV